MLAVVDFGDYFFLIGISKGISIVRYFEPVVVIFALLLNSDILTLCKGMQLRLVEFLPNELMGITLDIMSL